MNRNGFTIIEVLAVFLLASIAIVVVSFQVSSSMAISKDKAYSLMKKNLLSVSYDYIYECNQELIVCDFSFEEKSTFTAEVLRENGYFTDLESPIDGKDLGNCLVLHAKKENAAIIVDLEDTCY